MSSISGFLEKVDRVVSQDSTITVSEHTPNGAIACCDLRSKKIYIDSDSINRSHGHEFTVRKMSTIKGYNYHELAHLLYTCLNEAQIDTRLHYAHNILEDPRIEVLFSTEYPSSLKYFKNFVYRDIDTSPLNFLLIYGRMSFLPTEYVEEYRKRFVEHLVTVKRLSPSMVVDLVKKIENCFDKYIVETDSVTRIQIAEEFKTLLDKLIEGNNNKIGESPYQNNVSSPKENHNEFRRTRNEEKVKEDNEEKTKNTKKTVEKIVQKKKSDEKTEKLDLQTEKDKVNAEISKEILQECEDGKYSSSSGYGVSTGFGSRDDNKFTPLTIGSDDVLEGSRIGDMFKIVKNEYSSKYVNKKKVGRLNIKRVIQNIASNNNDFRVFSKFKKDDVKSTRVGMSILLDSSSSVDTTLGNAQMRAAYRISFGLKKIKSFCEVIEFSSGDQLNIMKGFFDDGHFMRTFFNGTYPENAMKKAHSDLMTLKRKEGINTLYCVVFTDGQWTKSEGEKRIINKLNESGIQTILIQIGRPSVFRPIHEFQKTISVLTGDGLYPELKKIVEEHKIKMVNMIVNGRN